MPHAYTEDQLVEQPAIGLFAELGWHTVSALEEIFGASGTSRRETPGEVVLLRRLRQALEKLNPALPPEHDPADGQFETAAGFGSLLPRQFPSRPCCIRWPSSSSL